MNEEIEIKIKLNKICIKTLTHIAFLKGAATKEIEKINSNIPDEIELNLDEDIDSENEMETKIFIATLVAMKIQKKLEDEE